MSKQDNTLAGVTTSNNSSNRRKDNINEKIAELLQLIPERFFADLGEKNTGTKDGRPNKGQILSRAVDYISWLQGEIDSRNRREVQLTLAVEAQQLQLQQQQQHDSVQHESASQHNRHTVAEEMLAQIGVGPLAEQN